MSVFSCFLSSFSKPNCDERKRKPDIPAVQEKTAGWVGKKLGLKNWRVGKFLEPGTDIVLNPTRQLFITLTFLPIERIGSVVKNIGIAGVETR